MKERSEILKRVTKVFRDEFDNDDLVITDETTADDVEEWDSLSHVQLISSIEKEFKIRFSSKEIMKWRNVGELVDSIISK